MKMMITIRENYDENIIFNWIRIFYSIDLNIAFVHKKFNNKMSKSRRIFLLFFYF